MVPQQTGSRWCDVLLGVLVGAASASRLSVTSTTFRATFREVRYESGLQHGNCILTMEGSFHSATIVEDLRSANRRLVGGRSIAR
jgi:hypothetical protein